VPDLPTDSKTASKDDGFVVFDHVQKSYDGEILVVKDLNLSIGKGEFLTMLGPSGSGKTTCLMMLAGFETATHGDIRLDGQPINNIPPHKRGIGMVFQNYALFPHMTVGENLSFPLEVRGQGKSEREANVIKALDMVQMVDFKNRRPAQLSGGQQQRIALARSLVFEPELVLMDEPLGALDKQLREHMQYEIKHLHERLGVTVVYVTHDQSEALTMSDRVAVFDDGIIQQLAPPDDLYERPENAFVAQFIGENNTLKGTIKAVKDGFATVDYGNGTNGEALAVNCGDVGSATTVSIRPERVNIGAKSGAGAVEAKVLELIYLGDHIRCRMEVMGNTEFVVKVPNAAGHKHLVEGETTKVSWLKEDCRALDAWL
jgi:putative spermidine/putrescine transport system ATP-binding protein